LSEAVGDWPAWAGRCWKTIAVYQFEKKIMIGWHRVPTLEFGRFKSFRLNRIHIGYLFRPGAYHKGGRAMIRPILMLSILWVMATSTLALAGEPVLGAAATNANDADTQVIMRLGEAGVDEALPDGQIQPVDQQPIRDHRDARWIEVDQNAKAEIAAVIEEIERLDETGDEPALQREIERIKLDAEISRLRIMMEDAEKQEDNDRVDAIWDEIEHLSALDEPVVGIPQKQPSQ
jgi:hypothetical protein